MDDYASVGSRWANAILHKLLDQYEGSVAFRRDDRTTRRIQIRMTDRDVPGYVSGGMGSDERRALHETMAAWSTRGVVELEWAPYEEGNLLARAFLQWSGIPAAYRLLQRVPKADELAEIQSDLVTFVPQLTAPWMQTWLKDVQSWLEERKGLPKHLLPETPNQRLLLLQSLAGLALKEDETMPMRLFSKRYLKSSKAFEQHVRSRIVRLLRQYGLPTWSETGVGGLVEDDAALLAEAGIQTAYEDVNFCGPLVLQSATYGEPVDCECFPTGLALDTEALARMDIAHIPVRRMLSIENKTNYHHYIRHERQPDELVVYLGGFPSPGKRRFLARLLDAARDPRRGVGERVLLHHWGDLDYGGILIAETLAGTVWPDVQPWRMEPERLTEFAAFVEPFDEVYRAKLAALLEREQYASWKPLIRKLLEVGGTLEQEAFLV